MVTAVPVRRFCRINRENGSYWQTEGIAQQLCAADGSVYRLVAEGDAAGKALCRDVIHGVEFMEGIRVKICSIARYPQVRQDDRGY